MLIMMMMISMMSMMSTMSIMSVINMMIDQGVVLNSHDGVVGEVDKGDVH